MIVLSTIMARLQLSAVYFVICFVENYPSNLDSLKLWIIPTEGENFSLTN